eukprot:812148_1
MPKCTGSIVTMGSVFTNSIVTQPEPKQELDPNTIFPTIDVRLQIRYILIFWLRHTNISNIPDEIVLLIADDFVFQPIYATQHSIKVSRQKHNLPLRTVPKSNTLDKRNNEYKLVLKLLVLGNHSVGKTCLCYRFCDYTFGPQYISNIGVDFRIRTIDVDGDKLKLLIWDTAGQERFRTVTNAYYRRADGILLVYDVTNRKSFNDIRHWNEQIEQHKQPPYVHRIIAANKCDLIGDSKYEIVSTDEAKSLCKELKISQCVDVSAKTGEGVDDAFYTLAKDAYQYKYKPLTDTQLLNPFL